MPRKKPHLEPEKSLGYQVRRCHRRFDRLLNAHLARHDIKTGFWYYLRVLWLGDGVTQKYLSDMTNVAENTTVAMINGMVSHDLVERVRDTKDRRKFGIFLTERGKALEKEVMQYAIDINRVAQAGIDPAEVAICASVLARMSSNLKSHLDNLDLDNS
ncbi:MarR family transcriptional regulator [Novosphingobium guangzhouense]|uniref:MarR family transcriptional regulator n=1 Tax=Novosphingobium guangzhouense TaxID=1850347 RepID=A0A2K2FWL3_9SPHN|nr:MarR family winged helix-turn-helix transcriptional regulator [Sphingobium sp. B2]PNU03163.1 MarR family transcriptional regulator [Novosphingobium guangzhouense]